MKEWLKGITRVDVKPRPSGLDLRYSEWIKPPKFFKKFLKTLSWTDFVQYPDTTELTNALANYHGVRSSQIYLAPGSAECVKAVFDCFKTGEYVVTTKPCFPMYDVYAAQNKLSIIHNWPEQDYTYSSDKLVGGDLVVISRPSNPVGSMLTKADVVKMLEYSSDRWVLIDEAYIDYATDPEDITCLLNDYDNLIIARSFSKTFGAAGIRVGYLLTSEANLAVISRLRQMYEVSGPAMRYALYLLDHPKQVKKYCDQTIAERNLLVELFTSRGYKVVPSEGNWIHVEQKEPLVHSLISNHILVKSDVLLPFAECKWLRITVGPGLIELFEEIVH
jgi:histidinol-phosphate aminotransferase